MNPRLFGSFVEHLGRCVYTGIYEPGHPTADERRLPQRRRSTWSRELGVDRRALPRRQLRLRLPLGGRRRPARPAPAPARPGLALDRDQRVRHRRVHATGAGQAGVEPMLAVNLGTRGVQEALRPARVLQPPAAAPSLSDLRRANGARRPVRRRAVVPRQRDGRPVADRAQDRRTSTAGSPPRPARAMRLVDPDLELVACGSSGLVDADVRRVGGDGARAAPTTTSTTSRCTPTTRSTTATPAASWRQRRRHGPLHRRRRSRPPTHVGAHAAARRSASTSPSTSGTSGTSTAPGSTTRSGRGRSRRALIEDDYNVTDAVVVGSLLIIAAAARRPRAPSPAWRSWSTSSRRS